MNPNNCCTLEAAKRLVEAGIVLETDSYHVRHHNKGYIEQEILSKNELLSLRMASKMSGQEDAIEEVLPALSMAEVWRELPDRFNNRPICVSKTSNQWTHAEILGGGPSFLRLNPTDALIDLLIWQKGQGNGKS